MYKECTKKDAGCTGYIINGHRPDGKESGYCESCSLSNAYNNAVSARARILAINKGLPVPKSTSDRLRRPGAVRLGWTSENIELIFGLAEREQDGFYLDSEEKAIDRAIEEITKKFNPNPDAVKTVKITLEALTEKKIKIGQQKFRNRLMEEDGGTCVFTADDIVVASHLNKPGQPLSKHGVLLRSDLSTRFDYKNHKLLVPINGGKAIMFNQPGHELHGKIARMSEEKAILVSQELKELRGL